MKEIYKNEKRIQQCETHRGQNFDGHGCWCWCCLCRDQADQRKKEESKNIHFCCTVRIKFERMKEQTNGNDCWNLRVTLKMVS